jgi:hypothetical protein
MVFLTWVSCNSRASLLFSSSYSLVRREFSRDSWSMEEFQSVINLDRITNHSLRRLQERRQESMTQRLSW